MGIEEKASITKVFRVLMKMRNARIVFTIAFLSFAVSHGFNSWLPKILETGGLSAAEAGFGASISTAASLPAVLFMPRLVPAHLRGGFMILFASLNVVTLFMMIYGSGATLITGLVLFGITGVVFLPILVLILMDDPQIDAKYMGSAGGLLFCVGEIGGFLGPFMMGALRDMTGTFLAGACFFSGLLITICAMTFMLKTRPLPLQTLRTGP